MEELKLLLLPLVAIIVSVIGFLIIYFGLFVKIKEDMARDKAELKEDMASLNVQLIKYITKTDLIWQCFELKAVELLKTYPTQIEKDVLLDKFKERSLSLPEAELLRTILDNELKSAEKDKLSYMIILGRLEQVIYDYRQGLATNNKK